MEHKQTVMICEDEPDLLNIYAAALKKYYNVVTAGSGKACIEKYMEYTLRSNKIDILLLDYRLGDIMGDDVACKIRDLGGTKTILITAYDLERKRVKELQTNNCIVDAIIKPVSITTLVEKVQQVLG